MDPRLRRLIQSYQDAVAAAVAALEQSGIPRPASNDEWATNGIPQRGALANGETYFKHGYGCLVRGPFGTVDFDFGDAGQIDGFDPWRLWAFGKANDHQHGLESDAELKKVFADATAAGEIQKSDYVLSYLARNLRS